MGHEKEPKPARKRHGGRHPLVHSHSHKIKRSIKAHGGRKRG